MSMFGVNLIKYHVWHPCYKMSTSDVNFYSNFGANLVKCQLLNISIYIADTNTGVCSDIGNTNTSFYSVSY